MSAGPVIRDEIRHAHTQLVEHLSSAGDRWSSTERVAIVAQVRRARAAEPLPPWVAPSTVDGLLDDDSPLSTAAIDAVWRIGNHPGSLTREWYDATLAAGLQPPAYVELVAVVAMTVALDDFNRAVGFAAPDVATRSVTRRKRGFPCRGHGPGQMERKLPVPMACRLDIPECG